MKPATYYRLHAYGGRAAELAVNSLRAAGREERNADAAFKTITREAIRIRHANVRKDRKKAKEAALATAAACLRFAAEVEGRRP